jgi:hypothetical protein
MQMRFALAVNRPFFRRLPVLVFALLLIESDAMPASGAAFPDPVKTSFGQWFKIFFYTAEVYRQNYAAQHRSNPYIVTVSDPKVEKLKQMYPGCIRKR